MNAHESFASHGTHTTDCLQPLRQALIRIGITAPTFYRWIRTGRIEDCRIRGTRGETYLTEAAIKMLRKEATYVEYVTA